MIKRHFALVGGQPFPVYRGIIDHQPDEVILVCSDGSEKQAEILEREIKRKMACKITIKPFNPVDLSKIRSQIANLQKMIQPEDEVVVNLSSGTKPWSILFYEYLHMLENVRCIFIDQNNLLWDFYTNVSRPLETALTLEETFGLNNIKVKSHMRFDETDQNEVKTALHIRQFRERWPKEFKALTEFISKHPDQTYSACGNSSLSWNKETKTAKFRMMNKKNTVTEHSFISPHIYSLLFNTGWFELEVADFLSQWEHAKEVWMNCVLVNMESNISQPINEIDIIVNTGNKLLFVECKTQVYDGTDIDKFNNAVKSYGGLASKRIFITDAQMKPVPQGKCNQAKIPFFAMSELRNDEKKKKMFFRFLTSELRTINEK